MISKELKNKGQPENERKNDSIKRFPVFDYFHWAKLLTLLWSLITAWTVKDLNNIFFY